MAKPKTKIDWPVLNAILAYKPTLADCAGKLEISGDTIERGIRRRFKMTFTQYRTLKMANTRLKLVQTALSQAFSGDNDKMLSKCLDNLCGWANSQKVEHAGEIEQVITVKEVDIQERINQLKSKKASE